jgi:hypothetical protein
VNTLRQTVENRSIRDAIETGSTIQGSVSIGQLDDILNGTEGTVQVTFVTLLQNGTSSTIGFCGVHALFPLDQSENIESCLESKGSS